MADKDPIAERRDDALRRALTTPPKPHSETKSSKSALTDADHKKKPGGPSVKKDRPEA